MAYKTLVFVALNLVSIGASDTNDLCPCDYDSAGMENSALWNFFKSLSADVAAKDKEFYAVVPGELSPPLECECDDKRKKRSVFNPSESSEEKIMKKLPNYFRRNHCPIGQMKFGTICVDKSILEDDY